jgi:hypothetical protein
MGREVAAHIEVLTSWIERSMPRINREREAVASKAALKKAARA